MKQKNKLEDFLNVYNQNYLKLSDLRKYNCYHLLYLKLNYFLKTQDIFKNVLFVHQQPNDIDYLTLLSEQKTNVNFFMTGMKLNFTNRSFYFRRIDNVYNNYEFNNFCYQPKFNENDWKEMRQKFNQIDLIILPSKIVDSSKKTTFLYDKKLISFLKKFKNAKIFSIGFDFCSTKENTKKIKKFAIRFDNFISITTNELIMPEREE